MNTKDKEKMIEDLQCPGCVCGHNLSCGSYSLEEFDDYFRCSSYSCGTFMVGGDFKIALGFPRGFNRIQNNKDIFLFEKISDSWGSDNTLFDFSVWKGRHDGRVFLRVAQPRKGKIQVHAFHSDEGYDDVKCPDVTDVDMD